MSDYTQIFDDSVSPIALIGQTTLSNIQTGGGGGGNGGLGIGSQSLSWYSADSIFGALAFVNTSIVTTGTLYFKPLYITKTSTFTDIGILNGSGTIAGTAVLGLYNDSGAGTPTGSPIANSNSTSLTNVSLTFVSYTFSSPITLTTGVYWVAYSTSASNTFVRQNLPVTSGRGLGINGTPASLTTIQAGWSQTFTYSATLPAVGSLTATTNSGLGDVIIYVKAQ